MNRYSILREGQYNELSKLSLDGKILDVGGLKNANYHELIKGKHSFTSVNIPPNDCDISFDIQKTFPFADGSFDHIVCLNVLEHIYGFQNAFSEMHRVLRSGGTFVAAIPFMHHIHGCPDDNFRYTESALRHILEDLKYKEIQITPTGLGVFSLIHQTISGALPGVVGVFFKTIAKGCDKVFLALSPRYTRMSARIPLGYFIIAKK